MAPSLPCRKLARLTGHTGPIHALSYSAGAGQYLLSGSSDRTINLYNPAKANVENPQGDSSALIQSYSGAHGYEVLSIAVAEDNARFVSGGGDKTVFVWDVATARTTRRFGGGAGSHGGRVECVAFGGEADAVVVSASFDSTVRLWDTKAQSNKPLMILSEARDSVSCLAVLGQEIMTGSVDGRLRVYDIRMGMYYVDVMGQPITSLTPTLQGDSILVSTLDSTIRLMDKSNGKMLQSYAHQDYTNTTYRIRSCLGAHDSMAMSGSEGGWIYAWDALTGQLVQRVRHYEDATQSARSSKKVVSALAYKKRVNEWASAGSDGTIVVWAREM